MGYSKLTAGEQGFWFGCGLTLLTTLLFLQNYQGSHQEAVHICCTLGAVGLGWIMRDEIDHPHWGDQIDDPKEEA